MCRCEDEKMRRCENVSQTPTIRRTLRSDALGKNRLKTMNKLDISERCSLKDRYVLVLFYVKIRVSQDSAGLTFCKKSFKKKRWKFNGLLHILKGRGGYLQTTMLFTMNQKCSGTLEWTTHPKKKYTSIDPKQRRSFFDEGDLQFNSAHV